MSDNNEISSLADSPLKAGNIDDFRNRAITDEVEDNADELAISNLASNLRKLPSFKNLSESALADKAEGMYALFCQQIESGVDDAQLDKIAKLLGEDPDELLMRVV